MRSKRSSRERTGQMSRTWTDSTDCRCLSEEMGGERSVVPAIPARHRRSSCAPSEPGKVLVQSACLWSACLHRCRRAKGAAAIPTRAPRSWTPSLKPYRRSPKWKRLVQAARRGSVPTTSPPSLTHRRCKGERGTRSTSTMTLRPELR